MSRLPGSFTQLVRPKICAALRIDERALETDGRENSQESAAWGHGAFTEALIEGLSEGEADLLHNGSISVSALDAYIAGRVKDLTEGHQHPVMSRPDTVPDFAFATAR